MLENLVTSSNKMISRAIAKGGVEKIKKGGRKGGAM